MVKELKKNIETNKYDFLSDSGLETDVILDFLSKNRQYLNLSTFGKFGQAIQVTLSAAKHICQAQRVHVVFDSYCELSVKEGERVHREAKSIDVDMSVPYCSMLINSGQALKTKKVFRFCPETLLSGNLMMFL